tara:strand:+ start:1408 stop:1893 length:486 start_codon:yes stop_codon:yes gene_type:complete
MSTYRYKFDPAFLKHLERFSIINKWCKPKDFKENFEKWTTDNHLLIQGESKRLQELGYDGDVIKKMYTSARYYFKNKSGEKKEPKKRKQYIRLDKEILNMIDMHIKRFDGKPSDGFTDFIGNTGMYFQKEIKDKMDVMLNDDASLKKIKKTYKNRCFMHNK